MGLGGICVNICLVREARGGTKGCGEEDGRHRMINNLDSESPTHPQNNTFQGSMRGHNVESRSGDESGNTESMFV